MLVGEQRCEVVSRALDGCRALFVHAEKPGDEGAHMGRELDQQLRGGDVVELRAARLLVARIGLMEIGVRIMERALEGMQQRLETIAAIEIAVAKAVDAEGRLSRTSANVTVRCRLHGSSWKRGRILT